MDYYFVNKEALENGDHEIHSGGCRRCSSDRNRIYLGFFLDCGDALTIAGRFYDRVILCRLCCGGTRPVQS
jgi:hypothetical protein